MDTQVRGAEARDLPTVLKLLQDADLFLSGVEEHIRNFVVAEEDGEVVGAMGLEIYGETALLRSAVVAPKCRGSGIGSSLHEALMTLARASGVSEIFLLTLTAERFFAAKGFAVIDRSTVNGPVSRSSEFTDHCPESAVCMQLRIRSAEGEV